MSYLGLCPSGCEVLRSCCVGVRYLLGGQILLAGALGGHLAGALELGLDVDARCRAVAIVRVIELVDEEELSHAFVLSLSELLLSLDDLSLSFTCLLLQHSHRVILVFQQIRQVLNFFVHFFCLTGSSQLIESDSLLLLRQLNQLIR